MLRGGELTSRVPCAQKINTAREESRLEHTQYRSESNKLVVLFDKTHANHDGAPHHRDDGEVESWANLADQDGRRRLEEDIGDEEDQVGNVLETTTSAYYPRRQYE